MMPCKNNFMSGNTVITSADDSDISSKTEQVFQSTELTKDKIDDSLAKLKHSDFDMCDVFDDPQSITQSSNIMGALTRTMFKPSQPHETDA